MATNLTAKEQALKDIKAELRTQNKAFIAFKTELNPIIRKIVSEQGVNLQKKRVCHMNDTPSFFLIYLFFLIG